MIYWNDLYKELAERITANPTEVRWVDLWHEQVNYLTEELPFPSPAVFVGFNTLQTDDAGKLVQNCAVQVDFYLFYETFSDTYEGAFNQSGASEFLRELTRLHALFHGSSGANYSEMRRTDMRREDSGGAGNLYRISFECLVTDYSAQQPFAEVRNPDAELESSSLASDDAEGSAVDDEPLFDVG